ncbi:MAG: ABC transporter permease subunit [Oscillospiraceae bacterium]|jgi:putative aldouronate transport system permease protein|nr:ABC transporter permease subunit [Oscillospiraceae bacterium]
MATEAAKQKTAARALRRGGLARGLRRDWELYLLLLLPMLFVLVFKYGSYVGLTVAFQDYKILKGTGVWTGFQNFEKVFRTRDFARSFRNTLLLNGLDLVVGFPMPILLALLLNEVRNRYFKKVSQTLLYLPHFLSWVIIGSIAYQLFSLSGIVNTVIEGAGGKAVPFLQENTHWLVSYIVIGVWQTMGWGTIVYLAAITGINPELYEAAIVDGASRFRQVLHITLPGIRATIVTLLIMNLGRVMGGSFERVYSLMNVATTEYIYTIPVQVYRWGLESGKYSQATALGLFQSIIGLALVLLSDFAAKRIGEEGLL